MRAVFICAGALLVAVSPAWGQFGVPFSNHRSINVYADNDSVDADIDSMMPFDAALAIGGPGRGSSSAWQMSRVSATEIFVTGGTGEVHWEATNGNAGASSSAGMIFIVMAPTQVRIRYELEIDTTSYQTWTGSAHFRLDGQQLALRIGASTVSDERMSIAPAENFVVAPDGYARGVLDETLTLLPGPTYELRINANSRCPGAAGTSPCEGKPISFTAHVQVIPEPSTWLVALLTFLVICAYRRFRS